MVSGSRKGRDNRDAALHLKVGRDKRVRVTQCRCRCIWWLTPHFLTAAGDNPESRSLDTTIIFLRIHRILSVKSDNRECLILSGSHGGLTAANSGHGTLLEHKRWTSMAPRRITIRAGTPPIVPPTVTEPWHLSNHWVPRATNLDSRHLSNYTWRTLRPHALTA